LNATLTLKVLKMQARTIASYALGSAFYSALVVFLFHSFIQQHSAFFQQYLTILPRALLQAFNISGANILTFGGFLGAEYLSFIWVVIVAAFIISFTSGAIAREIEQGTIELVLGYPVGRIRFFLSKVAALVLALLAIVAVTLGGIWVGALSQHIQVAPASFFAIGVLAAAFGLAIAGYGFLFSALASERATAAGAAAGLTILFYALNFASSIWSQLSGLGRLTIFHYYAPQDAINLGRVDSGSFLVLFGLALLTTLAGAALFRLRDLSP
jgi:ABC-2 type transport system permease protein